MYTIYSKWDVSNNFVHSVVTKNLLLGAGRNNNLLNASRNNNLLNPIPSLRHSSIGGIQQKNCVDHISYGHG